MKSFLFLLSAMTLAQAADNASLSGNWQIHGSVSGTDYDSTCTFEQKDSELTGTCTSDNKSVNITGKVDGKKVSYTYKSEYSGSPITVTHDGTWNGEDKITGTVSVPEYSADGDFTATRSK